MDDAQTSHSASLAARRLSLPRLVLIADGFTDERVAERVVQAAQAGVPWVHLRDHAADEAAFREAARALTRELRRVALNVLISVNSRLEVAEALEVGLHTGRHGPTVEAARKRLGRDALIGCSAHDRGDVQPGSRADYLFFSPVFPTSSKPGHPGAGRAALQRFCQAFSNRPVFALGGLTPERVRPCFDAGAYGVAVLSGILHANDPSAATNAYLHAFPDE